MAGFELVPGASLDRYELMVPLAEGGMAAVWLARLRGKRGFEQLVAIKVIKANLSEDVRFEQMFLEEARIASRIRHPNVAQILDLGEHEGVLYLVMEWIDGHSLASTRRAIEKRRIAIPPRIALRIMADAAAGLHAAHELRDESGAHLGVIHRDVSPQNILVSAGGAVKVIDFGVAKANNRAMAATTDGLLKGKVAYMSPEQADGLSIDRRTDIWAAGVCLYELLTGRLPFDGESQQQILRLLVTGADAPPLPDDLPPAVRSVIQQALARDPNARFRTAAALERALEGALDVPTTSDDVATFLDHAWPERRSARQKVLRSVEQVTASLDGQETRDITPNAEDLATLHSTSVPIVPKSSRSVAAVVGSAVIGSFVLGGAFYVALARRGPEVPRVNATVSASESVAPSRSAPEVPSIVSAIPPIAPSAPSAAPDTRRPRPRPKTTAPQPSAIPARPSGVQYDPDGIPVSPRGGAR